MTHAGHLHGALFGYRPDLAANIVGAVVFGIIGIIQFLLGIYTRDWWMWVTWSLAGGMESAAYIARAITHRYVTSDPMWEMQLVLSIIAPAFMSAGLYYQLAKQIVIYGEQYSRFRPMTYNAVFTTCDVIALIIQAVGGGIAAANLTRNPDSGGWIMVGGIAFQIATLAVFIIMYGIVNWRIHHDNPDNWDPKFAANRQRPLFKYWVPTICISLLFLMIRSIYRIVELADGWRGYILTTERYFLICDGLMIAIGMVPLCIIYPACAHGHVPIPGLHYKDKRGKRTEKNINPEDTNFGEGWLDNHSSLETASKKAQEFA